MVPVSATSSDETQSSWDDSGLGSAIGAAWANESARLRRAIACNRACSARSVASFASVSASLVVGSSCAGMVRSSQAGLNRLADVAGTQSPVVAERVPRQIGRESDPPRTSRAVVPCVKMNWCVRHL